MNLLPLLEKRAIRREYHKRLAVVALICLAVLMSMSLISIAVSYAVSTYEITALDREIALISEMNIAQGITTNISIIKDTNNKLDVLSRNVMQGVGYDLSTIFSSIINSKKARLTSLVYDRVEIKKGKEKEIGHRIVLGGIADSRESLRNFVKSLQSDERFKSVDLPISNLIESRDISFFITIMLINK